PPIIQALSVYLIVLGIFTMGSWGISLYQLSEVIRLNDLLYPILWLLVLLVSIFFITKSLINRKGRMASLRYLIPVVVFGMGLSVLFLTAHMSYLTDSVTRAKDDL